MYGLLNFSPKQPESSGDAFILERVELALGDDTYRKGDRVPRSAFQLGQRQIDRLLDMGWITPVPKRKPGRPKEVKKSPF